MDGLFMALGQLFPMELASADLQGQAIDRVSLSDRIVESALDRYNAREEALGEELMGALERFLLLQTIDERWREHLFDMEYLREGHPPAWLRPARPPGGVQERGVQPVRRPDEQRVEEYARMIFNVQVNMEGENGDAGGSRGAIPPFSAAGSSTRAGEVSYSGGHSVAGAGALAAAAAASRPRQRLRPGGVRRERPGGRSATGGRAARPRR